MKRAIFVVMIAATLLGAGCSGISTVGFNRFDKGRRLTRLAVIAHDQSGADRYKMWAWTKKQPRVVPKDTFDEEVVASLSAKTDYQIIPPATVHDALAKLKLRGRPILDKNELRRFSELTGADAVLFADVSFYLQNYLFYKTFGVVEITMRMVGVEDGRLLWEAKGRNFALFVSTDSALRKTRDKMLRQFAEKLERDKGMRS